MPGTDRSASVLFAIRPSPFPTRASHQRRVRHETGLSISIGGEANELIAMLAVERAKPLQAQHNHRGAVASVIFSTRAGKLSLPAAAPSIAGLEIGI